MLLDENLPKRLKLDFTEHKIYTVRDKGWQSTKNGELLKLMLQEGFDMLITFDRNLKHQQNFAKYPIAVLVLNAVGNSCAELQPLVPAIKQQLNEPLIIGATIIS